METAYALDQFTHARVIIGIVTGLSMARILTGIGRMIQRPARGRGRGLQLAWALFLLLWVTHFWWFEFGISPGSWTFGLYLFTIAYVSLFFFTCVILFPEAQDDPDGFAEYFPAHQAWFYSLLVVLFAADAAFSALKGADHLRELGVAFARKAGRARPPRARGGVRSRPSVQRMLRGGGDRVAGLVDPARLRAGALNAQRVALVAPPSISRFWPDDEPGVDRAEEGAGRAEIRRRAVAPRRDGRRAPRPGLFRGDALGAHHRRVQRLGAVRGVDARQQVVDRHPARRHLPAGAGDEAGQPGARGVRQAQRRDRRLAPTAR